MSCFWDRSGRCLNPKVGGDSSPEKCGPCVEYRGRLRGFGDLVHTVAKATWAEAVAGAISSATRRPCRCAERRAALNKALPFTDQGD